MYSSDSDSSAVCDEDEEGKLYQLVFELGTSNNEDEGKEEVQIPSSSENSPECQETDDERMYAVGSSNPVECSVVDNTYGHDTDALDNNQAVPVRKEKPWRKPGADITDYFNYGFDEKSWNTYCKKHAKARAARKKMYTKIKHCIKMLHECDVECSSCDLINRESRATLDVIGGRPGSRGRVEGRQCLSDEENISQVLTEMSFEEDLSTSHHLPSSSNFSSPFAYIPPPRHIKCQVCLIGADFGVELCHCRVVLVSSISAAQRTAKLSFTDQEPLLLPPLLLLRTGLYLLEMVQTEHCINVNLDIFCQ
ncbi:hypothetical protein ABVT39_007505 [Epinephelus coioides]